jgi:hypothetical protein
MKSIDNMNKKVLSRIKKRQTQRNLERIIKEREDRGRNIMLVEKAIACRMQMQHILTKIKRARDIYMGKQWEDIMTINGVKYTMGDIYRQLGKNPMNINIIQSTVRNVIGQYIKGSFKPIIASQNREGQEESEMMTVALQSVLNYNNAAERNNRQLENFILTGLPIYKTTYMYDYLAKKSNINIRAVSAQSIIINPNARDMFGEDIDFIGEIHEYSYNDMLAIYGDFVGKEKIKEISAFNPNDFNVETYQSFTTEHLDNIECITSGWSANKSKVLEIWQLDIEERLEVHDPFDASWEVVPLSKLSEYQRENQKRVEKDAMYGTETPLINMKRIFYKYWKTYHISLFDYSTLYESETPYKHNDHPYSLLLFPGLDGSIYGLIDSLIDIQMLFSRNIMLQDILINSSVKNFIIFPQDTLDASGITLAQARAEASRPNGAIKLKIDERHPAPILLSNTPAATVGINNVLQFTLDLLREASGVKDSSLGNNPQSGQPYSSYALSFANASNNLADHFNAFNAFVGKTYQKAIDLISQYWDEKQYINVVGIDVEDAAKNYDPEKIRNFMFSTVIKQSQDTDLYRDLQNQQLMELYRLGSISIEQLLKHSGNIPFADRMLNDFKAFREQLAEGKIPEGAPQWIVSEYGLLQQMQQQAGQQAGQGMEQQQALEDYMRNGGDIVIDSNLQAQQMPQPQTEEQAV